MSQGVPYADILILALIAGFILLRLRSVLGQKTGMDEGDFLKRVQPVAERVVQVAEKSVKSKPKDELDPVLETITDTALIEALSAIKAKDPQVTPSWFLSGAHQAFEMVFDAFVKGDKQTLGLLLSPNLSQQFCNEIDARAQSDRKTESTLVAITSKTIQSASLTGSVARIGVLFVSEQVHLIKDKDGQVLEGDPSATQHVEDSWVFERDMSVKNPNWKIIET